MVQMLYGSKNINVKATDCQPAEWEYAARSKILYLGYPNTLPTEVSWSKPKSQGIYHPIGVLQPNELIMIGGNVWEWVWDWYGPYNYVQPRSYWSVVD